MNQDNLSNSNSTGNFNYYSYINHEIDSLNKFSKFTHIQTKREYMDKRIKLVHSYVLFFAYSTNCNDENDYFNINQEWLEFFEEIKANPILSKYVEIVMV